MITNPCGTCSSMDLPHDYRTVGNSFEGTWDSSKLRGDTYYDFVAVVSYDRLKCTDSGVTLHVYTLEGVPESPPTVSASFVENEGGLNLTLKWAPPPRQDQNGNISYYIIFLNDSRGDVVIDGTNVSADVTEYSVPYDPALGYTYAVSACTSQGCGPFYHSDSRGNAVNINSPSSKGLPIIMPTYYKDHVHYSEVPGL